MVLSARQARTYMALDRRAGGHAFDFSTMACVRCGMPREHYDDNVEPRCTRVKPSRRQANEPGFVLLESENE